jgi:hypothetical protein
MSHAVSTVNRGLSLSLSRIERRKYCSYSDLGNRTHRAGSSALASSHIPHRFKTHTLIVRSLSSQKLNYTDFQLKESDIRGQLLPNFQITSVKDALTLYKMLEGQEDEIQETTKKLFWDKDDTDHPLIPYSNFPYGVWTRGQTNKEYMLVPSIFRNSQGCIDESRFINHYKHKHSLYSNYHKTTFDWLTLMQHYGAPTRLLDWTTNILVSLYFATDPRGPQDKDGALWLLNPLTLNKYAGVLTNSKMGIGIATANSFNVSIRSEMAVSNDMYQWLSYIKHISLNQYDSPGPDVYDFFLKYIDKCITNNLLQSDWDKDFFETWKRLLNPLAVIPQEFSERLHVQTGAFTVHGGKLYPSNGQNSNIPKIALGKDLFDLQEEKKGDRPFLRVVEIPRQYKQQIHTELSYFNVNQGTVYPELEHSMGDIKKFILRDRSIKD